MYWIPWPLLLFPSLAQAVTFPADADWQPVQSSGADMQDACGDVSGSSWWDMVGDAANPVAYVADDGTHLFFRVRIADAPYSSSGGVPSKWRSFGWGVMLETDWDAANPAYDYILYVDGNSDQVVFSQNSTVSTPWYSDAPELDLVTYPAPLADSSSAAVEYAGYAAAWMATAMG